MGLALAVALLVAAFATPHLLDWEVWSRAPRSVVPHEAPPLHGWWRTPSFGPGTLPAVLLAVAAVAWAGSLAQRLSWGRLLLAAYAAGLAWLLSLALVDGRSGLTRAIGDRYEYLPSAHRVTDVHALLQGYVDRIPLHSPDAWPTHPAGHPPLALLFFVGLDRVGLGDPLAAGLVVTAIGASVAVGVLVALRALGAEEVARTAAPFLVLTPAAVFLAVSADAVFAAVAAWGLACLALATRSSGARSAGWSVGWSVAAGLLLGAGTMMSYGLPLLGLVALAVLVVGRSWRPLPGAVLAALAVVLGFAAGGFSWWDAYPVLSDRYWDGIAADRPAAYWMWGNLAALLVSAGPLLGAGLGATAASSRRGPRAVVWLVGAAALSIVVADLSRMSKAEVERIWLPWVPWLTLSLALLPSAAWRRWALAGQVGCALVVQHVLYTSW